MKTNPVTLTLLAVSLFVPRCLGQYVLPIVGYVNLSFQSGDNWFGNPLVHFNDSPYTECNRLSAVIPFAPQGTTVSLWEPTRNQFSATSVWEDGSWSVDLSLDPGVGARLRTPAAFTNTFVGGVLDFDGSGLTGEFPFHAPPPFSGPGGTYFFSCRVPLTLSGNSFDPMHGQISVFGGIIGREPLNGERVTVLDPLSQTCFTTAYLNGEWDHGAPVLPLGAAAMFELQTVPEPSAFALLGTAVLVLQCRRASRLTWRFGTSTNPSSAPAPGP